MPPMITQNGFKIHAIRFSSRVTPADDHAYFIMDSVTKRLTSQALAMWSPWTERNCQ